MHIHLEIHNSTTDINMTKLNFRQPPLKKKKKLDSGRLPSSNGSQGLVVEWSEFKQSSFFGNSKVQDLKFLLNCLEFSVDEQVWLPVFFQLGSPGGYSFGALLVTAVLGLREVRLGSELK